MSQAEMLLANLDDQSAAITDDSLAEEHIVIDDNRYIKVPDSLKRLGVRGDHDIETVTIESPRYWDGHDMSQMKIYINYMCANGSKGQYPATNLQVADTRMTYDWTISSNVTQVNGKISFLVCIVKVDDEGYEERHWNSELNQECYVSDGLECDEAAIVRYPDIITYLLTRMEEVETVADPEHLQNYVNEWLRANHTNMYILADGETLDDAPADAIVVFDQNGESDGLHMSVMYVRDKDGNLIPIRTIQGPPGEPGPQGDKGEPGKTPVKGTDYFTDADKTEMVNAVIAALPKYDGEVVAV